MTAKIDRADHLERLKDAADIEGIAEDLGLAGRGKRYFCPACQPSGGKTPDLAIKDGGFTCFKCGQGGDIFALIQLAGNMSFPEAVRYLEGKTGISRPYPGKTRETITAPRIGRLRPSIRVPDGGNGGFKDRPDIYAAFLDACRPAEGRPLEWLTRERGISPEVIARLNIRFCGREYLDIIKALKDRFSEDALLKAGILKKKDNGRPFPAWFAYYAAKAGFLVIPYYQDGRPVFLKVRPPVERAKALEKKIAPFMNTEAAIPCLYNADALKDQAERVFLCEGETDTLAALSAGEVAVGSPGARAFKDAWIEAFRPFKDAGGRSTVFLTLDADPAGDEGARLITGKFAQAGLPVPRRIDLPEGADLAEFLKDGITE